MKNRLFGAAALLGVALILAAAAIAGELPASAPALAGMSEERLDRVNDVVQQAIDDGEVAGAAGLIIRNGEVAWSGAFGMADREAGRPMHRTICSALSR